MTTPAIFCIKKQTHPQVPGALTHLTSERNAFPSLVLLLSLLHFLLK